MEPPHPSSCCLHVCLAPSCHREGSGGDGVVCIAYCHHQMPDIIFLYHQLGVDSKATKSVPSPVRNLKEEAPDMTYDSLVKVIGQHFMGDEKEKVC